MSSTPMVKPRARTACGSLFVLFALLFAGCGDRSLPKPKLTSAAAAAEVADATNAERSPADATKAAALLAAAEGTAEDDRPVPFCGGKNLLAGTWEKIKDEEDPYPADNSFCYVCHLNYQEDKLTMTHQGAGVGCETCHGISDTHSADEDAVTPPDIMWPKVWINVTCMECHPRALIEKEEGHEDFLADADPKEVCTDCHAEGHRLKVRTRVWNKKTGELISDDGVRMMDRDTPATSAN